MISSMEPPLEEALTLNAPVPVSLSNPARVPSRLEIATLLPSIAKFTAGTWLAASTTICPFQFPPKALNWERSVVSRPLLSFASSAASVSTTLPRVSLLVLIVRSASAA